MRAEQVFNNTHGSSFVRADERKEKEREMRAERVFSLSLSLTHSLALTLCIIDQVNIPHSNPLYG